MKSNHRTSGHFLAHLRKFPVHMIRSIIVLILGFTYIAATGQGTTCSGNLGNNIFTQGDFGTGTANVVQSDPGIAPGFQYVTFVPFDDGKYTLTNSMAKWPNIYPTWLPIEDNSPDPNGYMMVVNASYAPGIFYQQTVDGLCDNTLYEFSADVINIVKRTVTDHILPNVSFLIDGVEKFTTGPIQQTEQWKTYGFTFTTISGQETVTLTLRNNAPGGIGNDLALDNISFRPCGPIAGISIDMNGRVCENALYPTLSAEIETDTGFVQWQISNDFGAHWSDISGATERQYQSTQLSAQVYYFRYLYGSSAQNLQNDKCRIVSDIRALEVVPVHFDIIDTLCEGLSFDLGGTLYSTPGVYHQDLVALNGCDSIVTLYLTIVPDPGIEAELWTMDPRCYGEQNGQIGLIDVSGGTAPYEIALNSMPSAPADFIFNVSAGEYLVMVADRYGCNSIQSVTLTDPDQFIIDATGDLNIILGHTTELNVHGNYSIEVVQWTPQGSLLCPDCITTTAMPLTNTLYQVTATAEEGCTATDSLLISVDRDPRVFIPNVFTPNHDQVNDTWGIIADALNVPTISHLVIFDRWGGVVVDRKDIDTVDASMIWNGRQDNDYLATGVYVYLLDLKMADDSVVHLSGTITLLR